jgi:hypothetical protein
MTMDAKLTCIMLIGLTPITFSLLPYVQFSCTRMQGRCKLMTMLTKHY